MEQIERLLEKQDLDASDAQALLQFLQDSTAPILSVRGAMAFTSRQAPGKSGQLELGAARKRHHVAGSRTASDVGSSRMSASSRKAERSKESEGKGKSSFDLSSLMEFPPMQSTSASSGKKKGKASRRITLTPVEPLPQATVSQFSSPTNPWRADPAFTCHAPSSTSPLHLDEERRLLQLERSRQRHEGRSLGRGGREQQEPQSQYTPKSEGLAAVGPGECDSSAFDRKARSNPKSFSDDRRGRQGHGSSAQATQLSAPNLDAKISRHSIFELSQSNKRNKRQASSSGRYDVQVSNPNPGQSSTPDLNHELQISIISGRSLHEFPTHIPSSTPITSTPLLPNQAQLQPSPARVTSKELLEKVVNVYAKVINERLVPNLTSEIHFVIQLLTVVLVHSMSVKLVPTELFGSLDNCVFFAVAVLNRIKHLLTALDKSTLQLLADNIRISEFDPELAAFFSEAAEIAVGQSSSHHRSWSQESRYSMGVPFQEDSDNSKNFPSVKSFHAFKKQRDSFYFVLREWEKNHERSNWNLQTALGEKIRQLIRQPAELCSHAHFARLFQKQLTESCRFSADALAGTENSSSLVHNLRKTNPDRFKKLSERFLQPSSGHGPCPPPTFSQTEEFFSEFILAADSYTFNHHLMTTLYAELMKLHSSCSSLQARDLPEVLHITQVLAKFLGFIEFLPYKNPSPDSLLPGRAMVQSFDLLPCIHEAAGHGHLSITLPWVVQHLSMMDPQAPLLHYYSTLLQTLVAIYRSIPLESPQVNCGLFLIITTLGWLFEIVNLSTSMLFEHSSTSLTLSDATDGLDSQDLITTELLYTCCPFLGDIRSLLAEFSAGLQPRATPIRKIKPLSLSTEADVVIDQEMSPAMQLQMQLQENFFRAHPPYLKQLCAIICERISAKLIHHCELHIISQHISDGIRMLATWLKEKCICPDSSMDFSSEENEPFSKVKTEANRQLAVVIEDVIYSASDAVKSYLQSECKNQVHVTMELLLSGTQSDQVIAAVSGVAATWADEKYSKWVSEKLKVLIQEELIRRFEKLQKAIKSGVKDELSLLQLCSLPLPSLTNSSVPHLQHLEDSKEPQRQPQTPIDMLQPLQLGGKGLPSIGVISKDSSIATSRDSETLERSPLEKFRAVTDTIVHESNQNPTAGQLEKLDSVMIQMIDYCRSTSSILPTIMVPQLVPIELQDALHLSVDLASYLVLYGVFTEEKAMKDLLREFVAFWKLTKDLKMDFPIERLMSQSVFERYTQQHQEVWQPLSRVLTVCVLCDLVASPVVEALWLCRKQQQESVQVRHLLLAAAIFLDVWYTGSNLLEGLEDVCVTLREIHFVRLLSVVLQELSFCNIPNSVLSHSHLQGIVHPF